MQTLKESFKTAVLNLKPEIAELNPSKRVVFEYLAFKAIAGSLTPHKIEQTKFTLTDSYLRKKYGCSKAFHRANNRLDIFQFSNHWDMAKRISKAVGLNEQFQQRLWQEIHNKLDDPSPLLDLNGRTIRKAPKRAIISKDSNGNTRVGDKEQIQLQSSLLNIDRESLKQHLNFLNGQHGQLLAGNPSDIPRIVSRDIQDQIAFVSRQRIQTWGILYQSACTQPEFGSLIQRYRESSSGRLQGSDIHLQNLIREVKWAALPGKFDHDIESCHFQLTHQLAAKHGYNAGALKEYIDFKDDIHEYLTYKHDILKDDAKQCFLAFIYGAPLTNNSRATLHRILEANAAAFRADPQVIRVKRDIDKCKRKILQDGVISGRYTVNAIGKSMKLTRPNKSLAAHILQGYEALALHIAIKQLNGRILLLSHDGFVTDEEVDTSSIAEEFRALTGLEISYKTERLTPVQENL